MPSLKEVRNRIKSVQSTQQITKAMKMVAAAKLRKAQDAAMQLRPYASKMNEILSNLSANSEAMKQSNFAQEREVNSVLLVVITSDRGLCGPFNTNILKATNSLLNDKYATQLAAKNVTFLCIGKRGNEYYSKKYPDSVISDYAGLFLKLNFEEVKQASEHAISAFVAGKFDAIEIIYNEFKNVATQIIRKESFLPIVADESVKEAKVVASSSNDYIFEPSVDDIVSDLVPRSLKIKFYKAVLESNASEHGARMSAMDKATENAGEMLKELKISYNRSRQASITKEILEIVGGAEALAAK